MRVVAGCNERDNLREGGGWRTIQITRQGYRFRFVSSFFFPFFSFAPVKAKGKAVSRHSPAQNVVFCYGFFFINTLQTREIWPPRRWSRVVVIVEFISLQFIKILHRGICNAVAYCAALGWWVFILLLVCLPVVADRKGKCILCVYPLGRELEGGRVATNAANKQPEIAYRGSRFDGFI